MSSWAATLLAVGVLGWAGSAQAQSVQLTESNITRNVGFDSSRADAFWISRSDCLADDVFWFPLTVSDYGAYQLELWVGGGSNDCTDLAARSGATPTCWKVWQGVPTSTTFTVQASVQDIVAQNKSNETPNGPGSGSITDCTLEPGSNSAPQAITLYFMFVDPTSQTQAGGVAWSTKFDLAGPVAPSGVTAGIGDTMLVLNWAQSTDTDIAGYRFYCDPVPGTEDSQSNVVPFNNNADGGLLDADVSDGAPATDASDDAACDPDSGQCGTEDASTADQDSAIVEEDSGSTGGSACPTTKLLVGEVPDEAQACGSGTGTSGRVSGLRNGFKYSIAVAGVDGVGNVGPLSNIVCDSPNPVDDFFKVYKDAGGVGGGGFCTLSGAAGAAGHAGLAGAFMALGLAAMLRRRGRR